MKKIIIAFIFIWMIVFSMGCQTQVKPLCRHIVLSQYVAFKDAGYEVELIHLKNNHPGKFKYHIACRIMEGGKWLWVEQRPTTYTTTTSQPHDTTLIRKVSFEEVCGWSKAKRRR